MKLIAELIGVVGFIIAILSFQNKKRQGILVLQLISCTCWSLHFAFLGVWSGSLLNLIMALRCLVFAPRGNPNSRFYKLAEWPGWIPVFILLFTAAVAFSWIGWICLLPLCGSTLTTFAMRAKSARTVRLLTLPNNPMWLIYNAFTGSIFGCVTEASLIISIIIGFLRHDVPARNKAEE